MKAIRSITRVAMLLCALWLFASWAEVVCKNTQVEPQYNQYNAFVLLTQQEEMKSSAEMAGSPLRLAEGVVTPIDGNTLTIVTIEDGEEWLAEAIDGTEFAVNDKLTIEFNTLGDSNLYNDEIVNFW
jgi:hypothetical protein